MPKTRIPAPTTDISWATDDELLLELASRWPCLVVSGLRSGRTHGHEERQVWYFGSRVTALGALHAAHSRLLASVTNDDRSGA